MKENIRFVILSSAKDLGHVHQYGGDSSLSATGGSACGTTFGMTKYEVRMTIY